MSMMIQKLLYDLLHKKIRGYPFYAVKTEKISMPCIVLESISSTDLPYSQESYTYQEVDVVLTIHDNKHSNKDCLEGMQIAYEKLKSLSHQQGISNLTLSTRTMQESHLYKGEISISFNYINKRS